MYRGDVRLGETIDLKFSTRSFTTGVPTTLAGSPVISAYVGNGTTEITAGITLSVDFDGRAGLHNVRVVATSGNGFATATNIDLVITTGTVGGVSVVGECIGSFSIEARSALMPTVGGRTYDVTATGGGGVDWGNVESPTTTLALTGTTIATTQKVDIETIKTNPVVNGGTITFPTTATLASTTNITAGTVTTATNVTTVNGLAAGVITAAAIATGAIDADALAADAVAEIADGVWDEDATGHQTQGSFGQVIGDSGADSDSIWSLANTNLDAPVSGRMATYTQPTGFLAATFPATVASTTNITAGTITTVTNLTNAPTAGDFTATMKTSIGTAVAASAVASVTGNVGGNVNGSVGSVAGDIGGLAAGAITDVEDAVWDAVLANHLDAGSTGFALNAAGSAGDPWGTVLPGAYGAGTAGFIIGTNLDALVTSRMATYTQPTGFLTATFPAGTIANTTNITAGTVTTVTTATNVTTVNGLAAGVITATSIAADAITAAKIADNAIDTATFAAGCTVPRCTLVDTITTYTGNTPQTGDSFARIGATGSGLTSLAPSATALSTVNFTTARAGYLDNLNVGGPVASQADINALNQSASRRVILATVPQYERPESGSTLYTVQARTFDGDGNPVNADSTPTLTATGSVSGSLSANLSAATNPATGVYQWTYTTLAAAVIEQIQLDVSATISAVAHTLSAFTQVTNLVSTTWTSTDASNLTAIFNKLPSRNFLTGSTGADGSLVQADLTNLDATISSRAAAATALSTTQWTNTLATNLGTTNTTVAANIDAAVSSRAPSATALSTVQWTNTLATNLGATNATVALNLDAAITTRQATFTAGTGVVFPSNFASLGITAGGKINGVVLADTLTTYTGNTVQTGDSFSRIGATGSGLTSLAPAAAMVKVQAAVYDTATAAGTVITLSNGATQTVTAGGRATV